MGAACDESDENTFAIMKKNCTNVNVEVIRFRLIAVGQPKPLC
jgi:hypothetical protein